MLLNNEHAIACAEEDHDADAANDGNEPSTGADAIVCADNWLTPLLMPKMGEIVAKLSKLS